MQSYVPSYPDALRHCLGECTRFFYALSMGDVLIVDGLVLGLADAKPVACCSAPPESCTMRPRSAGIASDDRTAARSADEVRGVDAVVDAVVDADIAAVPLVAAALGKGTAGAVAAALAAAPSCCTAAGARADGLNESGVDAVGVTGEDGAVLAGVAVAGGRCPRSPPCLNLSKRRQHHCHAPRCLLRLLRGRRARAPQTERPP